MKKAGTALPKDGIYLVILRLMMINVVIGGLLALLGELALGNEALSVFGTVLTLTAGVIYLFFRWLGLRESKRRAQRDGPR